MIYSTLGALLVASLVDASSYQYGVTNSNSMSAYSHMRGQVEEARRTHWNGRASGNNVVSTSKQLRKLQAATAGYIVADQFSSATCAPGTLKYSAVVQLGACVAESTVSSYQYSGYVGNGAGFEVGISLFSDSTCGTLTESVTSTYTSGCTDGVVYSYIPTAGMVPQGVMFAQYTSAATCAPSGPDFVYATVVPLATCYNGYEFGTCSATSYTYCRDELCPTPLPTVLPTPYPSPNPTSVPIALPTGTPVSNPTAFPTGAPIPPTPSPTTLPTYPTCPCGQYLDIASSTCFACASNTFNAAVGSTSSSACISCGNALFSNPGACYCEATPQPIANPTAFPIATPTLAPVTSSPTFFPTGSPIAKPTASPISAPTATPISNPTVVPSPFPTGLPIAEPTLLPIANPTASPTYAPCSCGSYFNYATLSCVLCAANTYGYLPGAVDPTSCTPCPNGKISNAGACICESIPTGEPTPFPTGAPVTPLPIASPTVFPTYVTCPCGSFLDESSDSCISCSANTYNALVGQTSSLSCLPCPSGQFSDAHSCSCAKFPTAAPVAIPTPSPVAFPTGNPLAVPTLKPTPFPIAYPTLEPTPNPSVLPTSPFCPCGQYLDFALGSCTLCPAGFYSSFDGAVDGCVTCPAGMTSLAGSCDCSVIPTLPPTFAPTTAPTLSPVAVPSLDPTLAPIPFNTLNPIATPTLSPTFAPSFSPVAVPTSEPSAPPTLAPVVSPTKNPIGTPTEFPTLAPIPSPTFNKCPCGYYLSVDAATCELCPANTFASEVGLTSVNGCLPCGFGYISAPGSCSCVSTPTNAPVAVPTLVPTPTPSSAPIAFPTFTPTFAPTIEAQIATSFPVAYPTAVPTIAICSCGFFYSPVLNTCVECSANTYMPLSGAWGCLMCPIGTLSDPGSCSCAAIPTAQPSLVPTLSPTLSPVAVPSPDPTTLPTLKPSPPPVALPTLAPTFLPTLEPTSVTCKCGSIFVEGSCIPCEANTYMPYIGGLGPGCIACAAGTFSAIGSCSCSVSPTSEPTALPTALPSLHPTVPPSLAPSLAPIAFGTLNPIANPTLSPTFTPTGKPVAVPTFAPTVSPSSEPIANPTKNPIGTPTELPSVPPTVHPTSGPCGCGSFLDIQYGLCLECPVNTFSPVVGALSSLTCVPCAPGTSSPGGACSCSASPTFVPTVVPTLSPTLLPTNPPVLAPSASPTLKPVAVPSLNPTLFPVLSPTPPPSAAPCPCGTFYSGGGCNACPVGTYMPIPGAFGCVSCPPGTSSESGSCACSNVPTALPTLTPTLSPTNTNKPTLAPTLSPIANPTALPIAFPTLFPTLLPTAVPCGCGSYMSPAFVCVPCGFGTYNPDVGASSVLSCLACPTNTFADPGSCACNSDPTMEPTPTPIALPTYLPTPSPTVENCQCGQFFNGASCVDCSAGSYIPAGTGNLPQCFICPVGTTSSTGACACVPAPTAEPTLYPIAYPTQFPIVSPTHMPIGTPTDLPTVNPTVQQTFPVCPCGQYLDLYTLQCVQCGPGLFLPGTGAISETSCAACPLGFLASPNSCTCYSVPISLPTPQPVADPTPLPSAYPTLYPSAYPSQFPIANPTTTPTLAPLPPTPSPTYTPCPCGTYSLLVGGQCLSCRAGSYQPETGMLGCYICPLGYTSNEGSCDGCFLAPTSEPTAIPSAFPSSIPISLPTAVPISLPTVSPISVPTAYPIVTPTSYPSPFPTGQPVISPTFVSCGCGSYLNTATNSCILCGVNTFSPYTDATDSSFCGACPIGTYSAAGACSCIPEPTSAPIPSPTLVPTPNPTVIETCSVITYTGCEYENGYYVSTSCTVHNGVYEADDYGTLQATAGQGSFLGFSDDSADNQNFMLAGLALMAICGSIWYFASSKAKADYSPIRSSDDIQMGSVPLKSSTYAAYTAQSNFQSEL